MNDQGDVRDVFRSGREELLKLIQAGTLSDTDRANLLVALEAGYAAAFSARTYDMHQAYGSAQKIQDEYQSLRDQLAKKS